MHNTHTQGYLRARPLVPLPPTGKLIELPPQTSSLTFNEQVSNFVFDAVYAAACAFDALDACLLHGHLVQAHRHTYNHTITQLHRAWSPRLQWVM